MFKNEKIHELEYRFSKFLGSDHSIVFPSGRIAQWVLYKAMEIRDGEIIAPAFGCIPVADGIEWSGNIPKFIDIDLQTYNIDAKKIEESITSKTKAINVVHLFGLPADMDEILAIGKKHNIPIIEDAAMAYGAEYKGKKAGTFGDAAMFSFEKSKPLTCFMGGMVSTNNRKIYEKLLTLRGTLEEKNLSGTAESFLKLLRYKILTKPQIWKIAYKIWSRKNPQGTANIGEAEQPMPKKYLSRLTPFQASMAIKQLERLSGFIAKRRMIAEIYSRGLKDVEGIILPTEPEGRKHIYARYIIRVKTEKFGFSRDELHKKLIARGIDTGFWYKYSLPAASFYKNKFGFDMKAFPNSKIASEQTLGLPIYPKLLTADAEKIVEEIRKIKNGSKSHNI